MEGQTASLKFDFVWNTAANQDPITVWRRVQAKHGRAQLLLSRHFRYVERLKNNDWSGRKRGADWKSECQYNIPPRVRRFLLSWQARIPLAARTSYKSFLDLLLLSLTVAFWSYFFFISCLCFVQHEVALSPPPPTLVRLPIHRRWTLRLISRLSLENAGATKEREEETELKGSHTVCIHPRRFILQIKARFVNMGAMKLPSGTLPHFHRQTHKSKVSCVPFQFAFCRLFASHLRAHGSMQTRIDDMSSASGCLSLVRGRQSHPLHLLFSKLTLVTHIKKLKVSNGNLRELSDVIFVFKEKFVAN